MIKRRSFMLLVRVSGGGFKRFVFPLLLPVLEETLLESSQWLSIPLFIFKPHGKGRILPYLYHLNESALSALRKLRECGRIQLVGVETDDVRIFIDLV